MILTKGATNTFFITSDIRKSVSEYYFFNFTSEMSSISYPVFPTLLAENDRTLKFQVEVGILNLPLNASVSIPFAGTYNYKMYIANSLSLTASTVLMEEGYMNLIEAEDCTETTTFTFLSDNENAEAIAYLGSTCTFTENLFYTLTLDTRKSSGQYYMLDIRSELTNMTTSVFPSVITDNSRYLQLGFTNSNTLSPTPLSGIVEISPAGTYKMNTYIADSLSLTASRTLLDERYIVITTCDEDTVYTFISDNENAEAYIYDSGDCVTCKVWSSWPINWNLDPVIWNECN